jgi:N-dimethylarginine dimethylaminohydrolase|tara:strand:+ start:167 stop:1195 length:1029 start_codon:yes stop_codon:yes gene_type:complete
MSVWAEFNPLKSCVIGTLPDPRDIILHTALTNRYEKYFTEIINKSRQELNELERVLNSFNVTTHRSVQTYPIYNGKTINTPPLAVRDIFTVYGDSLFKGNFAFEWNKDVPASCDHALEKIKFSNTVNLPTDNLFFDGDFSKFDPDKDLPRPMFHPTMALRIGNDIVIAKTYEQQGNKLGKDQYVNWINSVNPNAKFHIIDTEGHIDSQIFLVRPGLLLTSLTANKLPSFFDSWEKIYIESVTSQLLHKKNQHRHKKFHPVIAQWFHNFLETCTEETYFNLNSLSINEETVLFTGTHPKLFSQLEKKGITCIAVSMKATTFWDTGIHCSTNELERHGELENYA